MSRQAPYRLVPAASIICVEHRWHPVGLSDGVSGMYSLVDSLSFARKSRGQLLP